MKPEKYEKELIAILASVVSGLETRRPYAAGHSRRVAEMAMAAARFLGWPPDECKDIYIAGLLHDIGYLVLPDDLLNSADPLSPEQQKELSAHMPVGVQLLSHSSFLKEVCRLIRYHHHRFDGRGGGDEPSGRGLPRGSRLLHVVELFDALTTARPHRGGLSIVQALERLQEDKGLLDLDLVRGFIKALRLDPPAGDDSQEALAAFSRRMDRRAKEVLAGKAAAPTAPKAVGVIERMLRRDQTALKRTAGLIELDPALSLKIVATANSPIFLGVSPVKTVQQALVRIGMKEACDLLATYMYRNLFNTPVLVLRGVLELWWEHSLLCGAACQSLAGREPLRERDNAYLLGLLHDIGKPCLLKSFSENLDLEHNNISEQRLEVLLANVRRYHRQMGVKALEDAGLSAGFVQAVRIGPERMGGRVGREARLLAAAHQIVDRVFSDNEGRPRGGKKPLGPEELGFSGQELHRARQAAIRRYHMLHGLMAAADGDQGGDPLAGDTDPA